MKEWNIPNAQLVNFITILCVVSVKNLSISHKHWDHQKGVVCALSIIKLLEIHEEVYNVSHAIQEEMRQGSQLTSKQQREPSAKSANPDNHWYCGQVWTMFYLQPLECLNLNQAANLTPCTDLEEGGRMQMPATALKIYFHSVAPTSLSRKLEERRTKGCEIGEQGHVWTGPG